MCFVGSGTFGGGGEGEVRLLIVCLVIPCARSYVRCDDNSCHERGFFFNKKNSFLALSMHTHVDGCLDAWVGWQGRLCTNGKGSSRTGGVFLFLFGRWFARSVGRMRKACAFLCWLKYLAAATARWMSGLLVCPVVSNTVTAG